MNGFHNAEKELDEWKNTRNQKNNEMMIRIFAGIREVTYLPKYNVNGFELCRHINNVL